MIVDRDFEIVFFEQLINQWQRIGALKPAAKRC